MSEQNSQENKMMLTIASIVILVIFLGGVFFLYSKAGKKDGEAVYPAGINYTGDEAAPETQQPAPQKKVYDWGKLATTQNLATFVSRGRQYSYQYPAEMEPLIIPNDPNDSSTFDVAEVPAHLNLMILVESISSYDAKYKGNLEGFVRNYFSFFPGLKKLNTFEEYTSETGLKGYKATYETKLGQVTGAGYFFPVPGNNDKVVHISNVFPEEGEAVFTRILNSLTTKVPEISPTTAAQEETTEAEQ